jgi:murein DD-endopeptidase MepM/ murein hydrolase activator NlpD
LGCGDRLGGGGTSGNSSGVHLHFEIRLNVSKGNYYSGKEVDPFAGPCSTLISYWTDQRDDRPGTLCSGPVPVEAERRASGEAFATLRFRDPGFTSAVLEFGVPASKSDAGRFVALSIHAADGRLVDRPVSGPLPAGTHAYVLPGEGLPEGLYFYRIAIGAGFRKTMKSFKAR